MKSPEQVLSAISCSQANARVLLALAFQFIGKIPVLHKLLDLMRRERMDFQDRDAVKRIILVSVGARSKQKAVLPEGEHLTLHPVNNLSTREGIGDFIQTIEQDKTYSLTQLARNHSDRILCCHFLCR